MKIKKGTDEERENKLLKGICLCCNQETLTEDTEGYYCFNCDAEFKKIHKRRNWDEWIK